MAEDTSSSKEDIIFEASIDDKVVQSFAKMEKSVKSFHTAAKAALDDLDARAKKLAVSMGESVQTPTPTQMPQAAGGIGGFFGKLTGGGMEGMGQTAQVATGFLTALGGSAATAAVAFGALAAGGAGVVGGSTRANSSAAKLASVGLVAAETVTTTAPWNWSITWAEANTHAF